MIVALPSATPHTTPVLLFTEAVPGALLVHVPPVIILPMVTHEPRQSADGPVITYGATIMVTVFDVIHPAPVVAVMVPVPTAAPVAIPVVGFIVSIVGSTLLQVTGEVAVVYRVDVKLQKPELPEMVAGFAFTVTTTVRTHPVAAMRPVMVAVPGTRPLTTPADVIGATVVLLLLQVIGLVVVLSVVVKPSHTFSEPVIAPGNVFTVTITLAWQPNDV